MPAATAVKRSASPKKTAPVARKPAAKAAGKPAAKPASAAAVAHNAAPPPPAPIVQLEQRAADVSLAPIVVPLTGIAALAHPDWATRLNAPAAPTGALWPMVVDESSRAGVFFTYSGANVVDSCNPNDLRPEPLRKVILGALRFGKALVVDLRDVEGMWEFVERAVEDVAKGLWSKLLCGEVRQQAVWEPLIRPDEDGPRYVPHEWTESMTADFTLVFLAKSPAVAAAAPAGLRRVHIRA
uniref:Uncharacterized protein n=1 Tax=Neobodo designis TaxID=312471 RepID=A0A7S1MG39_NEODS|mmetsp:Transcript_39970/g.123497  ORF Transcript_39970/g.123497 Transcript_39970/m.123497 type:complete len:240 (+) Transcript_39970:47-766(+)